MHNEEEEVINQDRDLAVRKTRDSQESLLAQFVLDLVDLDHVDLEEEQGEEGKMGHLSEVWYLGQVPRDVLDKDNDDLAKDDLDNQAKSMKMTMRNRQDKGSALASVNN